MPDTVVAQALDNPLTLSLARDAYAAVDPVVLTEPGRFPTVGTVREHLIDQLLRLCLPGRTPAGACRQEAGLDRPPHGL